MSIEFNDANFEEEVINSEIPVLIDFWAEWCAPCKMIAPAIDELATEYDGKIKVGKINVDTSANLAAKYGVRSIPALIVFAGGKVSDQIIGAVPKQQIANMLDKVTS